ncbi:MAG: signal peptidase I [Bauldia sp.]
MGDAAVEDSETAPRRWWAAGLFAIASFGAAGYLYVGRPRRALVAALVFLAFSIATTTALGGHLARPVVYFATFLLEGAAELFFIVDSARIALHETEFRPQPYNRNWVYSAVVAGFVLLSLFVFKPAVRTFSVESGSMAPTLMAGDYILVDGTARAPERGTLIAMALPSDPSIAYLRRVIGLPGDRVQMLNGVLQLNGAPATLTGTDMQVPGEYGTVYSETLPGGATHLVLDELQNGVSDNTALFEVPAGRYFVLGDNRDNAQDSRMREVGGVPAANIIGTVGGIYWSRDRSRIGTTPE